MTAFNKIKIDIPIVIYYLLLVLCGWVSIYIADFHADSIGFRHQNQQLWIAISVFVAIFILLLNKRFFADFAYHYYILMILVLLAVLLFGKEINGAKAWFQFGSFKIQPAEFAKIATCLALAKYLEAIDKPLYLQKNILVALGIIATPLSFVVLQNDMGSALVYCSFFIALYRQGFSPTLFFIAVAGLFITIFTLKWGSAIVVLFIAVLGFISLTPILNKKRKRLLSLLLLPFAMYAFLHYYRHPAVEHALLYSALLYILLLFFILFQPAKRVITQKTIQKAATYGMIVFGVALSFSVSHLFNTLLQSHQKERILQVIGEAKESYNIMHSKIAIALGGFSGQGFLEGTHTKLAYVPEQETDFIFTTIGETYGFLGSTFIILLFVLFMIRLITLAERQTATFSRVYAYGVVGVFFFHFMINIGMVIGLLPVIGIPLPFFSYGGSSLLAFTILLFILVKLDLSREDRVI